MTPPVLAEVKGGGYMVASKSVEGAWRFVLGNGCSCPAGGRRTCRHRQAVDAHLRALSAAHARPAGAVNPSLLVD